MTRHAKLAVIDDDPTGAPVPPAAGRAVAGAVHRLKRDGSRVPLADSEYGRDRVALRGTAGGDGGLVDLAASCRAD